MQGTLSERIKKVLKDPEKIRLLMEYMRDPEKRKYITIRFDGDDIIIEENTQPQKKSLATSH